MAAKPLPSLSSRRLRAASPVNLDRVVHERVRLGIMSALAAGESLSFTALKQLLGLTDGNLSVHARKLEEAGYVACDKFFDDRTPRTEFRLTSEGQKAFADYLDQMEAIIQISRPS